MQFTTIAAILFATAVAAAPAPQTETAPVLDGAAMEQVIEHSKTCTVTDRATMQDCVDKSPVTVGNPEVPDLDNVAATIAKRSGYLSFEECWAQANDGRRALLILFPFTAIETCRKI